MAPSEDLIHFDIIEDQKENIQSLPGGRSAKKLAQLFSPSPLHKLSTPTPSDTKNVNDCIRAEFEDEVANLSESDDPLDIFDRYVRWTLDAYPSAQATPQSQLHMLLERATKVFIGSAQYRNDPRYLKLWLHYIRFFSDTPRETFVFLSRHSIGEGLALFYEEYAAWLEGAGRWKQAKEVYELGIEREARPAQRLMRKFGEFEQRMSHQPAEANKPSSPALPTVRPALAAKVDPFAAAARVADPQAPRQNVGVGGPAAKPAKQKLAVFSDADAAPPAMSSMSGGAKGWDTIGSLADRKKENTMEPKPWAGETLKAGGKKNSGPKMAVFKDSSLARIAESHIVIAPSKHQVIVNPVNGKRERVFVNLEAVYPTPEEPGTELSFEELWAASRGWLDCFWDNDQFEEQTEAETVVPSVVDILGQQIATKLVVHHDTVKLDENGHPIKEQPKISKSKKKKTMEVNETQIIKAKLDSPSRPKIRKNKNSSEPTMTLHTKAATDDIYDIFNAPLKSAAEEEEESDEDGYMTDGDYTSGGESTCTTRQISTSEAGDETTRHVAPSEVGEDETEDVKSISEWSDFTVQKHIPQVDGAEEDDVERNDTRVSDLIDDVPSSPFRDDDMEVRTQNHEDFSPQTRTTFIPIPPEDYVPNPRPYRDPAEVANNRLPFMTPITERTESSLGVITAPKPSYIDKTPSKKDSLDTPLKDEEAEEDDEDFEPLSSPIRDVLDDLRPPLKIAQPLLHGAVTKPVAPAKPVPKGPIIKDAQCNPVDSAVRDEILANMHPPLSSYAGFYDHRSSRWGRGAELKKYTKAVSRNGKNGNSDRSSISKPPVLKFPEIHSAYTLVRELGAGAFAPVYLVENSAPNEEQDENGDEAVVEMGKGAFAVTKRASLEALKMEETPSAWEFYMMRLATTRLGPQHRATASISSALELHFYQDESLLFLPFHSHGSLLDVVNFFREQPSAVMDEPLAMFFTIEILRTVEALHSKQILHGDLKVDNCLLRLDDDTPLSSQWRPDGSGGWASRGITLIDFGRGIDMRAFEPDVQFIADWKTEAQDCAEMREGRPWTWQIDYHGLAGIIHCLLFGKYIEAVKCDQGGLGTQAGRCYKIKDPLKRYWQIDMWTECFDLLLNPGSHVEGEEGARMPVMKGLRQVRESMEKWLEVNCERGVGLRSLMSKVEASVKARK